MMKKFNLKVEKNKGLQDAILKHKNMKLKFWMEKTWSMTFKTVHGTHVLFLLLVWISLS